VSEPFGVTALTDKHVHDLTHIHTCTHAHTHTHTHTHMPHVDATKVAQKVGSSPGEQ
jgi:hypothetical protein